MTAEGMHLDKGGGVVEHLANHVSPVVRAQVDQNPRGAASRRIITRGHLCRGVACDIYFAAKGSVIRQCARSVANMHHAAEDDSRVTENLLLHTGSMTHLAGCSGQSHSLSRRRRSSCDKSLCQRLPGRCSWLQSLRRGAFHTSQTSRDHTSQG